MSSKEDDSVFNCFAGSFTTAVSCEKNKRKWISIEIEKEYCNEGKKVAKFRLKKTLDFLIFLYYNMIN